MSDEVKLKPCPFCGGAGISDVARSIVEGHPEARKHPGDTATTLAPIVRDFWVQCPSCQTAGPIAGGEDDAIAAWNRRDEGWVSVEERLPDKNDLVFVSAAGSIPIYANNQGKGPHRWWLVDHEMEVNETYGITHWRPLPEPPTEDT